MSSPNQPKKILVVGVGRSGTTAIYSLLQRILQSTNPGSIDYVYEPFHWDRATFNKPFGKLNGQFQNISSLSIEGIYHHKSMPLFCDAPSQIGTDTQTWLKSLSQPTGENTHSLIKMIRAGGRLPAIKQLTPDLKIIALFRNPLEVINSSINMFSFFGDDFYQSDYERFIAEVKQRASAQASIIASEKRVEREYSFWRHINEQMVEDASTENLDILPIVHEQYISQRELIVRRICNHIGVEFDPAFVEYASEPVGPISKKKNHLTAQEYLFLEKQLDSYQDMMANLTDFQITDINLATREKFIVSNFCEESPTDNFFTSRHLRRELETSHRQIASLTDQIASLNKSSIERQQKEPLLADSKRISDPRDARIRTLEQQTNQKHDKIVELQAIAASHVTTINQIRTELTAEKSAAQKLKREMQGKQTQVQELTQTEKTQTTRIADLSSQLAQQQKLNDQNNATIHQLREELKRTKDMQVETTRLVTARDNDLLTKEKALQDKQQQLIQLNAKLENGQSTIEDYISRLDNREIELATLKQHVGELHTEITNLTGDLDRFAQDKIHAESRMQNAYSQLQQRELALGENVQSQYMLFETFKQDLAHQNRKLAQYEDILDQLRKITGYPLTQLDRKLRAYRKLMRTYKRIKPEWHENKMPKYSRRHLRKTKRLVRKHRIDLGNQMAAFYGNHRSGWAFAVAALNSIHNPEGIYLDTFIERTFCWNPEGVKPHTQPWVGFVHVPPFVPPWFQYEQSNQAIFQSEAWLESQPYCRGLFTLSKYHRDCLQPRFDFPVDHLIHPTEIPEQLWSWEAFQANREKRIVQLGWWLRKLHAIYQLPTSQYQKTLIKVTQQDYLQKLFNKEKEQLTAIGEFNDSMYESVEEIQFLPNDQYDNMLSANIVFLNLYDSSANNSVIECIARGTPLLVNRIQPVVEYLGSEYPFYYDTMEEAVTKASDHELVRYTHQYLLECETRQKLSGQYFVQELLNSNIMLNVYQDFKPELRAA